MRSTLAGFGQYLKLDPELLDDLKTAISEACNNVVLHAYGDGVGPMLVSLEVSADGLGVTVRDHGIGLQRVSAAEDRMGVGLAVISALASRAEFGSEPGEGTEVRMSFAGANGSLERVGTGGIPARLGPTPPELDGGIVADLAPAELLPEVMGRLVRAVAAGAHFSVDRFPALHQLTSAIGAQALSQGRGHAVAFSIDGSPKRLELRAGPLPQGSGESLFEGRIPDALEPLVKRVESSQMADGELLHVAVVEPRP